MTDFRLPRIPALALGVFALAAATVTCDREEPRSVSATQDRGVDRNAPRLRLRVSGNLGGYLMPCGCASGQLGGLARRAFRNRLDGRNIDLFLEGGNLIKKAGELEFSKLIAALEVLAQGDKPYQAIGLAAKDLTQDLEELAPLLSAFPFVASDLQRADGKPWALDGAPVVAAFRDVKAGVHQVRIASLTMGLPEGPARKSLRVVPPAKAWATAMQGVQPTSFRIAMIHADGDAIRKLKLAPRPDLIVAINNDYTEPPPTAQRAGDVPLVFVGVHGRLLVDVTVARGKNGSVVTAYAPVALKGSRTAKGAMRDKNALSVILGHRQTVKEDNMLERLANRKPTRSGARYVGGAACAECHDDDADTCAAHAHSHAWRTLVEAEKREKWPVTSYPECVSCHVVGYGEQSGFISPKKTPKLLNVTCENCHGPGSKHVASGGDTKMPHGKPGVSACTQCHNFEHSPKFNYTEYWKRIVHGK